MPVRVTRGQALAYRFAAQGLARADGGARGPGEAAVLDIGLQDTPAGSARYALAARLADPAHAADPGPGHPVAWTLRGAPHLHRAGDLPDLARGLWPVDDEDALYRIGPAARKMRAAGDGGLAGLRAAVDAMRKAVTGPVTKGEVSAAVTAAVPEAMTFWCRACDATHVHAQPFMLAGLAAGVRVVPGGPPTMLDVLDPRPGVPDAPGGTDRWITAYLRLLGPAGPGEVAAWLGARTDVVRELWPASGLAEVRLDGRAAWLPEESLDALAAAGPGDLGDAVRLLPPGDPWLQARDRSLIVPDEARRKQVWRALAAPGVIVAGGEVVGTWRARTSGRTRLDVTLTGFGPLPAGARRRAAAEAERLAAARGVKDVRVVEG